ncbi:MAG: VWA domain-containing protein, partial [Planctomycetales bacterium]|nr:VWA domain-containing protein [Planctomycetales bacterium]
MFQLGEYFNQPWYLVLIPILLPAVWIFSSRTLSGLGSVRKWFAIAFRSLVILGLILALAEMQFLRKSDRMTVIYVLDQSASIPKDLRDLMVEYVKEAVSEHRDAARGDRAALIIVGREANIEIPPIEDDLPILGQLETFELRRDATNLESGLKLAQATFPEDSSRRIVVVTDGNENVGDVSATARLLAQDGVGVDVVPIELGDRPEVAVERVTLPNDIRKGQPFSTKIVVNNITPEGSEGKPVNGTLKIARRMGSQVQTLDEQAVTLQPGKNVYSFKNEIELPDFYEYEAIFVPDDADQDVMTQNNRATAYTHVLGQGHVLVIEDWENPGQFDFLVQRLQKENLQVTLQSSKELFSSLAELQRYDTVVLANVPRASGSDTTDVTNFSDEQILWLVHNTQDTGCGLVMIGGPQSFGAGGWSNTELEKALPVDFQINNAKVAPVGALGMVMHASEMAQGNFWQKKIGEEALKALGPQDYCGVIHWQGTESWLWNHPRGMVKVGPNRRRMVALMSRMTPGDMPFFDPSLKLAAAEFTRLTDAAIKHMIVISDGDPSPAGQKVLSDFKKLGVKVSTVAVGTHGPAGHSELRRIAKFTGGKYYVVNNPRALPRIFQREARRVARPLVKEQALQPIINARHEILQGIDTIPQVNGFVLTTIKEDPRVEVPLLSPDPVDTANATLLATWQFGLGRSAAWTSDAGARWAQWNQWDGYDKFFSQMIRWSMRPTGDTGNYNIATNIKDGKVHVVVTAIDQDDQLINSLDMSANAISPTMESGNFEMRQTAPGRYVGSFDIDKSGSYFVSITPGSGKAPIRSGINVPYSSEYRDRETNRSLIEQLAGLTPVGGKPGMVVEGDFSSDGSGSLLDANPFRRDLRAMISSRDIWPLLVLVTSCIFFADVFIRRVAIDFDWVAPLFNRMFGQKATEPKADERMERLRSRKREIEGRIDERRAAARFEPEPDADVDTELLDTEAVGGTDAPKKPLSGQPGMSPAEA